MLSAVGTVMYGHSHAIRLLESHLPYTQMARTCTETRQAERFVGHHIDAFCNWFDEHWRAKTNEMANN